MSTSNTIPMTLTDFRNAARYMERTVLHHWGVESPYYADVLETLSQAILGQSYADALNGIFKEEDSERDKSYVDFSGGEPAIVMHVFDICYESEQANEMDLPSEIRVNMQLDRVSTPINGFFERNVSSVDDFRKEVSREMAMMEITDAIMDVSGIRDHSYRYEIAPGFEGFQWEEDLRAQA